MGLFDGTVEKKFGDYRDYEYFKAIRIKRPLTLYVGELGFKAYCTKHGREYLTSKEVPYFLEGEIYGGFTPYGEAGFIADGFSFDKEGTDLVTIEKINTRDIDEQHVWYRRIIDGFTVHTTTVYPFASKKSNCYAGRDGSGSYVIVEEGSDGKPDFTQGHSSAIIIEDLFQYGYQFIGEVIDDAPFKSFIVTKPPEVSNQGETSVEPSELEKLVGSTNEQDRISTRTALQSKFVSALHEKDITAALKLVNEIKNLPDKSLKEMHISYDDLLDLEKVYDDIVTKILDKLGNVNNEESVSEVNRVEENVVTSAVENKEKAPVSRSRMEGESFSDYLLRLGSTTV